MAFTCLICSFCRRFSAKTCARLVPGRLIGNPFLGWSLAPSSVSASVHRASSHDHRRFQLPLRRLHLDFPPFRVTRSLLYHSSLTPPPTPHPTTTLLQHNGGGARPGAAQRLPQEPRRLRLHHHPDREEAAQARLPVQCHLRWYVWPFCLYKHVLCLPTRIRPNRQ